MAPISIFTHIIRMKTAISASIFLFVFTSITSTAFSEEQPFLIQLDSGGSQKASQANTTANPQFVRLFEAVRNDVIAGK